MTDDSTEGNLEELKGRGQEAMGDLTGDEDQQAEGQASQAKGKGEQALGDVKKTVEDATGS